MANTKEQVVFIARMMDAETGSEGTYEFNGPKNLMKKSPVKAVRLFIEHADANIVTGQNIDYHLNAAFSNRQKGVVTGLGSLITKQESEIPFVVMISRKRAA